MARHFFAEQFAKETLLSEKMRATILAGIFSLLAVVFTFLYLFFREDYLRVFRAPSSIQAVLMFLGLVAGYELLARFIISYRVRADKKVPEWMRYWNAFIETSTPTILIIIVSNTVNPFCTLPGPASFGYFLFRNFTPFAAMHTPEEIIVYQNAVFGFMIDIINGHHGLINQFLGDGFMSTFGAPLSYGNDSRNSVEAAREIIARLQQENENGNIPPTRVGIGIHAGEVVTGNVGSALRKQYSITGNTVIIAARIEQLNKQYQLPELTMPAMRGKRTGPTSPQSKRRFHYESPRLSWPRQTGLGRSAQTGIKCRNRRYRQNHQNHHLRN